VSAKYLIYFSAYIHGRSAATWGYLAANFKWARGNGGVFASGHRLFN